MSRFLDLPADNPRLCCCLPTSPGWALLERGHNIQTWKMSIYLHKQIFLNPKFHPEARKLCQNENRDKTANNANNTICITITTFIPLWYPALNISDHLTPFFTTNSSFTKAILLKTAQNCDREHIFDKTAYGQSQDFTLAQKIYTSSAPEAHAIFHV